MKLIEFFLVYQPSVASIIWSGPARKGCWSQQSAAKWQSVSARRGEAGAGSKLGCEVKTLPVAATRPRAAAVLTPPESTTQFCRNPPSINFPQFAVQICAGPGLT